MYGTSSAWSVCVWVMRMKSARWMCLSMVAVSDSAASVAVNRLRVSPGRTSSFGDVMCSRERYGSTSSVVRPSLISHPAVPRYFSVTFFTPGAPAPRTCPAAGAAGLCAAAKAVAAATKSIATTRIASSHQLTNVTVSSRPRERAKADLGLAAERGLALRRQRGDGVVFVGRHVDDLHRVVRLAIDAGPTVERIPGKRTIRSAQFDDEIVRPDRQALDVIAQREESVLELLRIHGDADHVAHRAVLGEFAEQEGGVERQSLLPL